MQISFDPRELKDMSEEEYASLMHLMRTFRSVATPIQKMVNEEIPRIVSQMYNYGLTMGSETFSVEDLYESSIKLRWIDLPPTDRKALGKTFSQFVQSEHNQTANKKIVCNGRTQQNRSLYRVEKNGSN